MRPTLSPVEIAGVCVCHCGAPSGVHCRGVLGDTRRGLALAPAPPSLCGHSCFGADILSDYEQHTCWRGSPSCGCSGGAPTAGTGR